MPERSDVCPLCRAAGAKVKYQMPEYAVRQCGGCRFQFNDAFSSDAGKAALLFDENYYLGVQKEAFAEQMQDFNADPSLPMFNRGLDLIEKRRKPGRLLDVGSAMGTFLNAAKQRGWAVKGIEISAFSAAHARKKYGLDVHVGAMSSAPAPVEPYDAITFWDSIEHVNDPAHDLATAARWIKPDGLILATTDNFDCLIADCARLLYALTGGRFYYGIQRIFIPHNRSFFTEKTFLDFAGRCGLEPVYFKKIEYPLSKIKANILERLLLSAFYLGAALLGRQAQFLVVLKKKGADATLPDPA